MVDTALASLTQTIEKISLNQDHYSIFPHHNQQITSIYEQLISLQQFADVSPANAEFLERRLGYVASEAHTVIEHFISDKFRCRFRLNKCVGLLAKIGKGKTNFNQQLQRIKEEIDSIVGEVMEMETTSSYTVDLQVSDASRSSSPARISSPILAETRKIKDMDSLGDDSLAIKLRLCGGSSKLQVIPIVGMGGIGKTTLAGNVYNDLLTIEYFDLRAWATLSQDYSTQKIVSGLVDSLKEFIMMRSGESGDDEEKVYKCLKGRRYLIVIDDIWSRDAWDELRDLFPDDYNGSRIMLTTRLSDVAAYSASCSPLHEMQFMSVEQSWELIRQRVVLAQEGCSPELENIGKKIAESCGGLPLAVVVIAGLLSTVEKKPDAWWEMAKNVSSIVGTEDGRIDEILSLSYNHLPHHLRPCLLHMGGFPEDHEIRISKLVKLWVAEGFLRHSEGSSKNMEEEAEECLEDLVNRSLVLVRKRKYNGKIKSCSLHDLIRDLCIRKAQENSFFLVFADGYVERKSFIQSIKDQHCIIVKSSGLTYRSSNHYSTIHTIRCFPNISINLDFLKSVTLLRVLVAENIDGPSIPDALFGLFHLRYLAIGFIYGCMIPAAISKLQNLQTLIIGARDLQERVRRPNVVYSLPQEIWMMTQLRHLICCLRLPYPEDTTSTLENLQTLSLVLHDKGVEGILEKIPNIKKLRIDCSHHHYDTHLNNLVWLESLELCNAEWQRDSVSFPKMLRRLTLSNMSLPWSEMSIVGSLPNLEVLKLREFACIGSTWETSQGGFPVLQFLLIETSKLQHWITESDHFPRLRFLLLRDCLHLNEIPNDIGEIATLELIDMRYRYTNSVRESLVESAKRIQEEQQSLGNYGLQVCYPLLQSFAF